MTERRDAVEKWALRDRYQPREQVRLNELTELEAL